MSSSYVAHRAVNKKRASITALPLYYSGHLLKKHTGEQAFKSFFGELRGSTIFLYADEQHDMYSEKLELQDLREITLNNSERRIGPWIYTLRLVNEEVHLKVDSQDVGEEWRCFILTVAMLEIPSKMQLLPGQVRRLEEVLELERKRASPHVPVPPKRSPHQPPVPAALPSSTYEDVLPGVPCCFFSVTREEAQRMLVAHPENGNMILRPAADSSNFAITIRPMLPSGPVTKHYRVQSKDLGFIIELDKPVMVSTLRDVLEYFVKEIPYSLRPYIESQAYDTTLVLHPKRSVNPERTPEGAKTIPRPRLPPTIQTSPSSPASPQQPSMPHQKLEEESEYLEPDDMKKWNKVESPELCFKAELLRRLKKRSEAGMLQDTGQQ